MGSPVSSRQQTTGSWPSLGCSSTATDAPSATPAAPPPPRSVRALSDRCGHTIASIIHGLDADRPWRNQTADHAPGLIDPGLDGTKRVLRAQTGTAAGGDFAGDKKRTSAAPNRA